MTVTFAMTKGDHDHSVLGNLEWITPQTSESPPLEKTLFDVTWIDVKRGTEANDHPSSGKVSHLKRKPNNARTCMITLQDSTLRS